MNQHSRPWLPAAVLATWTLIVWVGRVRNVLGDSALTGSGRNLRLALALSFVLPALTLAVLTALAARRTSGDFKLANKANMMVAAVLAVWTVVVWVVRGLDIVFDQQFDVGFRVVHSALALLSVAVAAWVIRVLLAARSVSDLVRTS